MPLPARPADSPLPLSRRALLAGLALAPVAGLAACSATNPSSSASSASATARATATSSAKSPKPGPVVRGTLYSKATGLDHDWVIYYPPGSKAGAKLPVAIVLHGLGDNISIMDGINYSTHLAQAVGAGVTPFALAGVNGGALFWQKTGSQDAGAMVATDFVATLRSRGLNTSRLGLTGWSMGGWGTLRLACDELHGRLRAVAALSTPCYPNSAAVPGQSWMTSAAFDANNFYNRTALLTDLPIMLACGTSDGFYPGNVTFLEVLKQTPGVLEPVVDFGEGNHSPSYWESVAPTQFAFLGSHL